MRARRRVSRLAVAVVEQERMASPRGHAATQVGGSYNADGNTRAAIGSISMTVGLC